MLQLLQKSQVLTTSCTVLDWRSCTSWFARYPISGFLKTSNEPVATGEWHGDIVQWTNLHAMHWNQRLLVQLTMCHGALVWQIGGAARWCLYNLRWSIQHYQSHARIHIHKPINGIQHTRRIGPAAIVSKSLESHTVKVLNVVYVLSLRSPSKSSSDPYWQNYRSVQPLNSMGFPHFQMTSSENRYRKSGSACKCITASWLTPRQSTNQSQDPRVYLS